MKKLLPILFFIMAVNVFAENDLMVRFKQHRRGYSALFVHASQELQLYGRTYNRPSVMLAENGSELKLWAQGSGRLNYGKS